MITAENICLKYGNGNYVFKDFSFFVKSSEHVCFAGPSGKGKSSVLKMLQAYVIPQKGEIKINELLLSEKNIQEIRAKISYIPQNINLPSENGFELANLLGLKDYNTIFSFLKELGLTKDFFYNKFDEISGGQKQRVVISICLSLNRNIILMDEPSASLDSEATQKLIKLIKNLKNKTIVSASHNTEWINEADKTIYL